MATFQVNSDRKQISIILNLVKFDCIDLYRKFRANKVHLKQAIELYEEFMTNEINTLFQYNNNFSDIVLSHRNKFSTFNDEILKTIYGDALEQQHQISNGISSDDNIYVLFIALQQWLVQGPKGQQFYFMIDIDSFSYTKYREFNFATRKQVFEKCHSNIDPIFFFFY